MTDLGLESNLNVGDQIEPEDVDPGVTAVTKVCDGVDYSERWNASLPKQLYNSGYRFAVRYIGTPGRGKSLVKAEVEALRQVRISLVSVYEDRIATALEGHARGAKDALAAVKDAESLGMPNTRPVYLAVDTDTTPARVAEYFKGACAAIGKERVGIYAGYWVIKGIADMGLATYFWQTRAWSKVGGKFVWDDRDHLRQFPMSKPFYASISGIGCDIDWAMKADYGQWDIGTPTPPSPGGTPPLRDGGLQIADPYMHGHDVSFAQYIMFKTGIPHFDQADVNGTYSPMTAYAVCIFQDRHELVVDGWVGAKTYNAMRALA